MTTSPSSLDGFLDRFEQLDRIQRVNDAAASVGAAVVEIEYAATAVAQSPQAPLGLKFYRSVDDYANDVPWMVASGWEVVAVATYERHTAPLCWLLDRGRPRFAVTFCYTGLGVM